MRTHALILPPEAPHQSVVQHGLGLVRTLFRHPGRSLVAALIVLVIATQLYAQ
jgi:hypothetical protein